MQTTSEPQWNIAAEFLWSGAVPACGHCVRRLCTVFTLSFPLQNSTAALSVDFWLTCVVGPDSTRRHVSLSSHQQHQQLHCFSRGKLQEHDETFWPQKRPECVLQENSLSFNFPSHTKHHDFFFLFGGARGCYLDPLSTYLGAQAHRKFTQVRPQAGMKGISVDVWWNQHCWFVIFGLCTASRLPKTATDTVAMERAPAWWRCEEENLMRCHSCNGFIFCNRFISQRTAPACWHFAHHFAPSQTRSVLKNRAQSWRPDREKEMQKRKKKKNLRTCCKSTCYSACHVKFSHFNAHCKHQGLKKEWKYVWYPPASFLQLCSHFSFFFARLEWKLKIYAVGVWTCCFDLQQEVEAALCFSRRKKKCEKLTRVCNCVYLKKNKKTQLAAVCCALYHTDASRQVEVFPLLPFFW